ncbi:MAG: hypothetical protein M3Q81_04845 [bacterium]|nr:hypothetical protein [bacterium]
MSVGAQILCFAVLLSLVPTVFMTAAISTLLHIRLGIPLVKAINHIQDTHVGVIIDKDYIDKCLKKHYYPLYQLHGNAVVMVVICFLWSFLVSLGYLLFQSGIIP